MDKEGGNSGGGKRGRWIDFFSEEERRVNMVRPSSHVRTDAMCVQTHHR